MVVAVLLSLLSFLSILPCVHFYNYTLPTSSSSSKCTPLPLFFSDLRPLLLHFFCRCTRQYAKHLIPPLEAFAMWKYIVCKVYTYILSPIPSASTTREG